MSITYKKNKEDKNTLRNFTLGLSSDEVINR